MKLENKAACDELKDITEAYCSDGIIRELLEKIKSDAKEKEVDLDITISETANLLFISDDEKKTVFGCMMEPAISEAAECEKGRRWVTLDVFMGNKFFLIIEVENTCADENRKEAKEHQISLDSMDLLKELARKYGGSLEITKQDGQCQATLMISSYKAI